MFFHDRTSFNDKLFPMYKRLRNRTSARFENAPEGLPALLHVRSRVVVIHPFVIRQPDGFHLIERQDDLLQCFRWHTRRFETTHRGLNGNCAAAMGSASSILHVLIIGICS